GGEAGVFRKDRLAARVGAVALECVKRGSERGQRAPQRSEGGDLRLGGALDPLEALFRGHAFGRNQLRHEAVDVQAGSNTAGNDAGHVLSQMTEVGYSR